MSSIDDLRGTLDRHAEGFVDHDLHVRPVAVRERVRAVRRRRRSMVWMAAAAVVAAVGVTVVGLGGDQQVPPADRTLAGHVAPEKMTSLGYTYAFAHARQGDGKVILELPRSDQPRLLSWATAGPDDRVTLRAPGEKPETLETDDFGDYSFVAPRTGGTFTLTGSGQVALAAYDLTDAPPAGDTSGGVTFRSEVAGQRLVADAFGKPGTAELSLDLDVGAGPLPISYLCSHGPKAAWIHISLDGEPVVFGAGCDDSTFDPGGNGGFTSYLPAAQAGNLHLRIWVTDGEHGSLVDDADLRVGLAAYAPAETVQMLAGTPVTQTTEFDGHVWTFVDTTVNAPGERAVQVAGVDGRDTLAVLSFSRTGSGTIRSLVDGRAGGTTFAAGGAGSTRELIPAGDHTAGLRATGAGIRADVRLGVARYVRID